MKLVENKKRSTEYYLKVLVNPNEPDEAKRIYEVRTWGIDPPQGQTVAAYRANIRQQIKDDLAHKYKPLAETTLPGEGSDL